MDYKKALSKCMQICSRREYCTQDIIEKLFAWQVASELHEKIVEKLFNDKFIDHNRYTHAFVNDKFRFNNWGKVKIRYQLKQKYIEDNIIIEHLNNIEESDYIATLNSEICKKLKTAKANSDFERHQKVARYVISKGFEPDLVFKLLKTFE